MGKAHPGTGANPVAEHGPALRLQVRPEPHPGRTRRGRANGGLNEQVLVYTFLIIGGLVCLFPLYWMVTTSVKTLVNSIGMPPQWFPKPVEWRNYPVVFGEIAGKYPYLWNSLKYGIGLLVAGTGSSALVAFGFGRLRFPGRDILFIVLLSTMILPGQVTMIPIYLLIRSLGWIDSYKALIVPSLFASPGWVFLMRQYVRGIPKEMDDAARVDGCGFFGIFLRIFLPQCKPILLYMGASQLLIAWGEFFNPLIFLRSQEKFPLALALNLLPFQIRQSEGAAAVMGPAGQYFAPVNLMMAISTIMIVPAVLMFFALQKYFIKGVVITGLKG